MIKNLILKKTAIPNLSKGLDVYSLRQKTISGNIANAQTPGYRSKEVKFESHLQNALNKKLAGTRTDKHHLTIGRHHTKDVQPTVSENLSIENISGVNNVNVEKEMVEQVKNEIRFLYGSRLINRNFAALRASIKGRYDQ